jgi:simple sugar transport system permease protein
MLNFIVLALLNWVVAAKLHDPETLHTPAIHAGRIARISSWVPSWHGSAANGTLWIAELAAVGLFVVLFYSRFGYEVRAVGLSPEAADAGGISVRATWVKALVLGGALAGIGGTNFVLGYKGYYEDGLAGGAGFMGIAVALVGRNHPIGVFFAALLFATLSQGGLAIHAMVPKQLVEVLQATVILAMAAASPEVKRLLVQARAGAES